MVPLALDAVQHAVMRYRAGAIELRSNMGPGSAERRYTLHRVRNTRVLVSSVACRWRPARGRPDIAIP
jgi:hypothetical protein